MGHRREVKLKGISKTPLNKRAFIKLVRHYYKGPYDVQIVFDMRIGEYGYHIWDNRKKVHIIHISPKNCSYGKSNSKWDIDKKEARCDLVKMNKYDTVCRLIHVALHELVHANQCDRDLNLFWKMTTDLHETIRQSFMRYELSELETEAEGRALLNFNKALERYERWCEE